MPESRLSHYVNSKVSTSLREPVQTNMFDVFFTTLPKKLASTDLDILYEHVNSISGLQGVNPALDTITQKFKFSDRSFGSMPSQTYIDITIEFSMNLNDAGQAYVYKMLRDWYRLVYDPETGYCGIKKDYVGDMKIIQYGRSQRIFRTINLYNVFPTTAPETMDTADYNSADPAVVSLTLRCDYFEELLA